MGGDLDRHIFRGFPAPASLKPALTADLSNSVYNLPGLPRPGLIEAIVMTSRGVRLP